MSPLWHIRLSSCYFEAFAHLLSKGVYLLNCRSDIQLVRNGIIKQLLSLCLGINKPLLHVVVYGAELLKCILVVWKQLWAEKPWYLKSLKDDLRRT